MTLEAALKMTNRRVNALEFVLIPRIQRVIDYIKDELDEIDREDFVRLKKTQDKKKEKKAEEAAIAAAKRPTEEATNEGENEPVDVIPDFKGFDSDDDDDEDIFV